MITLITGGTRGIGKAISIKLKEVGFNVVANFSGNVEAAEKFNKETGIPVYKWSIGSAEECEQGVRKIEKALGDGKKSIIDAWKKQREIAQESSD